MQHQKKGIILSWVELSSVQWSLMVKGISFYHYRTILCSVSISFQSWLVCGWLRMAEESGSWFTDEQSVLIGRIFTCGLDWEIVDRGVFALSLYLSLALST